MENYWLSLGAIRAKVENGRVVDVKPFELDKYPTEMINGIKGLIYSESRIRYPMVRLDWLKNKEKATALLVAITALFVSLGMKP